jgi:hypothetical protein
MRTTIAIGISMVLVFLGILEAILQNIARKKAAAKAREDALVASGPKTWVSVGVAPPPGLSVALKVIQASYTHLPDRGTIEWVDHDFSIPGWPHVAGTVMSYRPAHIKLMTGPKVEETALAHEMGHLDDSLAGRQTRESPGDKGFVAEFQAVNAAIAKVLGR